MEYRVKRSLFALLLVINLVLNLVLSPVSVTRAEAKTKLSVTVKLGSKKASKKIITMKKGSNQKIKLSIAPKEAGIKTKYKSDKKSIVSVSKAGKLKAKKTGTAKITVTLSGDNIRKTKIWFKVKVIRQSDSNKNTGTPVVLTVNGQTFQAVFYNNKTAGALLKKMPMTLNMKEMNGNEKYHYFDTEFPTNEKSPGKIKAGDIMMYGSDCLVTFYKSFSTSYQYTSVGKITDASGFAKAVRSGNVTITFKKGKVRRTISIPEKSPAPSQTNTPILPTETPIVMPTEVPTVTPSNPLATEPTESTAPNTVSNMYEVMIKVNEKTFPAKLYQTETTKSIMQKLPLSITMNELNGNEKYYYFSESFPTESERVSEIHSGDLKLYGSSCLVLFYESFVTSYSYTSLGYVEHPEGLAEALGIGSVNVDIFVSE